MINPALINVAIPGTLKEIVTEIGVRNRDISKLIAAGRFADIWLPAFEAKDLALAIIGYGPGMPTYKRRGIIRQSIGWCTRHGCLMRLATSAIASRSPPPTPILRRLLRQSKCWYKGNIDGVVPAESC